MSRFLSETPRKSRVRSTLGLTLFACLGAGAVFFTIGLPTNPLHAAGGMGAAEGGGISAILFGPPEGSGPGVGGGITGRNTDVNGVLGGAGSGNASGAGSGSSLGNNSVA